MDGHVTMVRWVIAAAAITALVYTLVPSLPGPVRTGRRRSAAMQATSCPADAKKANLDFTVNDMNGKSVALSSYKGKVIVLDFWATGARPARPRFPASSSCRRPTATRACRWWACRWTIRPTSSRRLPTEFKMNYPVLVGLGRDDLQDAYGPMWGFPRPS